MTDEIVMDASIEALICDMDGLLVDSEPIAERAMADFLAAHGRVAPPDLNDRLLGRRLPEAVAIVAEWFALTDPLDDLIAEFDERRTSMLRGNLPRMPGVEDLLGYARDAGLRLALATSNRRHQATISLEETGLVGRFEVEVTGDEVSRGKPEPDIFLLAAERLGVPPARSVVLEDAPAGVAAARAAGMRCIFVPNAHSLRAPLLVAPTVTVPSLTEAAAWLRVRRSGAVPEPGPIRPGGS